LTNDRRITRKLKEIILTARLGGVLEKQIHQEQGNLSSAELRKAMKEKVLELYLNYIFFGNNAYGVEAASQTYFGKSAKDLTILEASILASIPK
jgi:membrane peptidoglycan carboxypeptidase